MHWFLLCSVRCRTDVPTAFLLGWQRSTPQLPGDTFSDEMSLHDMAVALKMHHGSNLQPSGLKVFPELGTIWLQIPSAKAAMMTIGRTGKELETENRKQITATMTSDGRTYKKQVIFTSITNYMPSVCQQKNAIWSEGRKESLQEKVTFLIRLSELAFKKSKCLWAHKIFIDPLFFCVCVPLVRFTSGYFEVSLLLMPDWGVQEGQMKYSLQTTGTRTFLLEVSTLREMEKG